MILKGVQIAEGRVSSTWQCTKLCVRSKGVKKRDAVGVLKVFVMHWFCFKPFEVVCMIHISDSCSSMVWSVLCVSPLVVVSTYVSFVPVCFN